MIYRSMVVAMVLFSVWTLVIQYLPADLDSSQTLWGENVIHAQDYLYAAIGTDDLAIVGSSLSENLRLKNIGGRHVHNLGFSGQSVHDGLNIIMAADKLPAYVLVEMNIIMQAENEQFQKVVLQPAADQAREYLPALRQRYQPVGVLKGMVLGRTEGAEGQDSLRDRPINQLSLDQKMMDYEKGVHPTELMAVLSSLSDRLSWLRSQGVQVLFYEMPVHPALCQSPKAEAIRKGFQQVFPTPEFTYIPQPECADYDTTDGHHLGERSNAVYSEQLAAKVRQLIE